MLGCVTEVRVETATDSFIPAEFRVVVDVVGERHFIFAELLLLRQGWFVWLTPALFGNARLPRELACVGALLKPLKFLRRLRKVGRRC